MALVISESMERSLTLSEQLKLRLHLYVCAWCKNYLLQIKIIREIACSSPADDIVGPGLSDEMRTRIRNNLHSNTTAVG